MWGSIAVGAALIAVVALIVRYLIRSRKRGESPCGCGGACTSCGMHCHCAAQKMKQ